MMTVKKIQLQTVFTTGLVKENPILRMALGLCPALAVTTSAMNGLGMGMATCAVLICSNMIVSLLRKVIPVNMRIPANIVIVSGIVTMVHMLIWAFLPEIDMALGIFLPLIAVNCLVFGRAESFARKNKLIPSAADGLGMGLGFTLALVLIGSLREILGQGSWFGLTFNLGFLEPMQLFILPPGGLLIFAFLVAIINGIALKKGQEPVTLGCQGCPSESGCHGAGKGGC